MIKETIQPNRKILDTEEVETTLNVEHYHSLFHIYTSCQKTSKMLLDRLPDYYELSKDKLSATCNDVPINLITKLYMSGFKGKL